MDARERALADPVAEVREAVVVVFGRIGRRGFLTPDLARSYSLREIRVACSRWATGCLPVALKRAAMKLVEACAARTPEVRHVALGEAHNLVTRWEAALDGQGPCVTRAVCGPVGVVRGALGVRS